MRNKVISHLRRHYVIYVVSFLLSLFILGPLIAFPFVAGESYKGINIAHFDRLDQHFYLSRGKEVLEDHNLGSPVLREDKDNPDTYFNYGEKLMLAPVKWLGLADKTNIVTLYNFYNFGGVFLLMILVYFLVWQLSHRRLLSLTSAVFVVGGYHIAYTGSFFYDDFNFYARAMYPYVSSLIFFAYLNLLVLSLKASKMKCQLFSGLIFGLMFYVSFYGWTFLLALNSVLLILFLFSRNRFSMEKVAIVSIVGLAVGSLNLYQIFSFFTSDIGREFARFFGAIPSHTPVFSGLSFSAFLLVTIFFVLRKTDSNRFFILALISSGLIALNQQVITGTVIQHGHYYWYFIVPSVILGSSYVVWSFVSNEFYRKVIFSTVFVLIFVHSAIGQYKSFFTTFEAKIYEQSYQPLIDILDDEVEPSVILGPLNRSGLLFTIYTKHDLFWNSSAVWSYNPEQRFNDVSKVYKYLDDGGSELADEIKGVLNLYGVGYIVWDKNIYPNWNLDNLNVSEVIRSGNIYLYRID